MTRESRDDRLPCPFRESFSVLPRSLFLSFRGAERRGILRLEARARGMANVLPTSLLIGRAKTVHCAWFKQWRGLHGCGGTLRGTLSSAVSGLTCPSGEMYFKGMAAPASGSLRVEESSGFGLDPSRADADVARRDARSFVAVQGDQRRVGIAALPGHDVRILPYALPASTACRGLQMVGRCALAMRTSIGMCPLKRVVMHCPPRRSRCF